MSVSTLCNSTLSDDAGALDWCLWLWQHSVLESILDYLLNMCPFHLGDLFTPGFCPVCFLCCFIS